MKAKHFLLASALLLGGVLEAQTYQVPVSEKNEKMQEGEFEPTWESLQNYKVPEWFRNAKFGIWAHWGRNVMEGSGGLDGAFVSIWKVRTSISTMWNIMAIPLKWASRIYCLCLKPRNGIRTNWFPFIRRLVPSISSL